MDIFIYINNKEWKSSSNILSNAHKKLLEQVKKGKNNVKDLEKYLNDQVFYPKRVNSNEKVYREKAFDLYKEQTDRVINAHDWSSSLNSSIDNQEYILRDKYESFKHKNYILVETMKKRLEKFNEWMKTPHDFQALVGKSREEIEKITNEAKKVLDQASSTLQIDLINNDNPSIRQAIQNLDDLYKVASRCDIISNDYGIPFELCLSLASMPLEDLKNKNLKDIVNRLENNKIWTGSSQIERKSSNFSKMENLFGENSIKQKNVIKVGNFKIINSYGSSTSAKADVIFQIPGSSDNEVYHISAKNWSTINSSKDFGNTDILSALMRSEINEETLIHYVYNYGAEKSQVLQQIHKLNKLSLAIDILRGNFVATDYNADVAVINDRARKHVFVYDINYLIKNYENTLKFQGYENFTKERQNVINQHKSLLNGPNKVSSFDQYAAIVFSTIHQIKVAVQLANSPGQENKN